MKATFLCHQITGLQQEILQSEIHNLKSRIPSWSRQVIHEKSGLLLIVCYVVDKVSLRLLLRALDLPLFIGRQTLYSVLLSTG